MGPTQELRRETVIEVRGLATRFGDHAVHEGLDLDVYRGEVLGVVGGSGTGKSVLLREIAGLMRPTAGSIRVFGIDLSQAPDAERQSVERRWGVMFQDGALFSALDVQRNVEAPMREQLHLPHEIRAALARLKVSMVGLPPEACHKLPSELSGGMRKRAGLARALALDPELVFLDEPTAGLDPIGAAAFDTLIRKLADALGLTVFLVTHDLDSLRAICDRIAVLAEKRVLVTGTMQDMLDVDHPWVRAYFHGPRARAALKSG
jgi:phospholipid/cholesterol/gamma-HCH transport system ATP-binding protein